MGKEADGPFGTEEVFELLSSETRLRIIEALGDLSDRGEYSTIAFSELQRAVGVEDNGRFSYHLDRLIDRFVERSEAGYALTLPGIRVYQTLQTWVEEPASVEPFPLPYGCERCDDPLHCGYENQRFRISCPRCERIYCEYPLSPGAFDPDDGESLHRAAATRVRRDFALLSQRMCPYCSGTTTVTVEERGDHPHGEVLTDGDVVLLHGCERCNWFVYSVASSVLTSRPAVVSFLYDRGVDLFEVPPWSRAYTTTDALESTDPLRIELRYRCDGDALRLLVDERLRVLESDVIPNEARGETTTD